VKQQCNLNFIFLQITNVHEARRGEKLRERQKELVSGNSLDIHDQITE